MAYIETGSMSDAFRKAYPKSKLKGDALNASAKKIMHRTPVRLLYESLQLKHQKRHDVTVDKVVGELARIAFTDVRDVIEWGATLAVKDAETDEIHTVNSVAIKAAKDLSPDAAASIAGIEQTKDGAIKIKFHDKRAALVDLGKHLGIFKVDNEQGAKAAAEAMAASTSPRDLARAVLDILREAKVEGAKAEGSKP